MYKILIVDDEKLIREGINKVMDWEQLNIDQVYLATSGSEALECLDKHKIDIMVTDISMTEMTGLELIEATKEKQPELSVIVLTGYDSFEYARRALQLKVAEFLLKPVDEDLLKDSIQKVIDSIEEEKIDKKKRRTIGLQEQTRMTEYFQNLLAGNVKTDQLDYLKENYPELLETPLRVALLIPPLGKKGQESGLSKQEIFAKCVAHVDEHNRGVSLFSQDEEYIIMILFTKECKGKEEEILEKKFRCILSVTDVKPYLSMGGKVPGLEEISKSYNEAITLIENEKKKIYEIFECSMEQANPIFRDVYEEMKK